MSLNSVTAQLENRIVDLRGGQSPGTPSTDAVDPLLISGTSSGIDLSSSARPISSSSYHAVISPVNETLSTPAYLDATSGPSVPSAPTAISASAYSYHAEPSLSATIPLSQARSTNPRPLQPPDPAFEFDFGSLDSNIMDVSNAMTFTPSLNSMRADLVVEPPVPSALNLQMASILDVKSSAGDIVGGWFDPNDVPPAVRDHLYVDFTKHD